MGETDNKIPSLKKNPSAQETLREKLFLLWGDLEERKTAQLQAKTTTNHNRHYQPINGDTTGPDASKEDAPKSKPFQCCLQEYGVRARKAKSGGEDEEEGRAEREREGERRTVWERRWRMLGTTII